MERERAYIWIHSIATNQLSNKHMTTNVWQFDSSDTKPKSRVFVQSSHLYLYSSFAYWIYKLYTVHCWILWINYIPCHYLCFMVINLFSANSSTTQFVLHIKRLIQYKFSYNQIVITGGCSIVRTINKKVLRMIKH